MTGRILHCPGGQGTAYLSGEKAAPDGADGAAVFRSAVPLPVVLAITAVPPPTVALVGSGLQGRSRRSSPGWATSAESG